MKRRGVAALLSLGLLASGCVGPGVSWETARAGQQPWQLRHASSAAPRVDPGQGYTLRFSDDGRVAGTARGRTFFGTYARQPDQSITFAALGYSRQQSSASTVPIEENLPLDPRSTSRSASSKPDPADDAFLARLSGVDRYLLPRVDRLKLLADGRVVLEFEPTASKTVADHSVDAAVGLDGD